MIYHGVNLVRDSLFAASKFKVGCGIFVTGYVAASDFLVMHCVIKVLSKKGLCDQVIDRLRNLYKNNITVVVVNNVMSKSFLNH